MTRLHPLLVLTLCALPTGLHAQTQIAPRDSVPMTRDTLSPAAPAEAGSRPC
jgi:hypothetical protein